MVVAPLYSGSGIIPIDISKGRIWSTKLHKVEKNVEFVKARRSNNRFVVEVEITPSAIELAEEFNFGDKPKKAREKVKPGKSVPLKIVFDPARKIAELFDSNDKRLCLVKRGEWSNWLMLDFGARGEGSVRFYLFSCDEDSKFGFTLMHSSAYPTHGFAYPEGIATELIKNVGPFLASPILLRSTTEGDAAFLGGYEYQGLWMARTAKYLLDTYGWDLCYQHYHIFDSATHRCLDYADPEGVGYNPAKTDYYVSMMRKAYQITDRVLGIFMQLMDDETVLVVLSNHRNVLNKWAVDYLRVLEAGWLLAYDEDIIMWNQIRAFMMPQKLCEIYINMKGKFLKGTVDPNDYGKVREEIIDILLNLRNPDGKRVIAYALKKKDAQILGYYGSQAGDVVFVFNSFHRRCKLPRGEQVKRATGGVNHGPQIATTRTGFSSNLASGIFAGPNIRQGYVRDDETQGLWKLTDIVPTIAHILDFAPPRDSRGGVMYDIFQQ